MNISDLVNGLFESIGGILCWWNFFTLLRDKKVMGVSLWVAGFFCCFSAWNMFYYPHLNQILSFFGAAFLLAGNLAWQILAMYYTYKNKKNKI